MNTAQLQTPSEMSYEDLAHQFIQAHQFVSAELNRKYGILRDSYKEHPDFSEVLAWFEAAETELKIRHQKIKKCEPKPTHKKSFGSSESYINAIHEDQNYDAKRKFYKQF